MRGLAFKIFLSFWLVFAVLFATFAVLPDRGPGLRMLDHVRQNGRVAAALLTRHGAGRCADFVAAVEAETHLRLVLFDAGGTPVCLAPGVDAPAMRRALAADATDTTSIVDAEVTGSDGAVFTAVGVTLPAFDALPLRPPSPWRPVLLAIVVSGLVCFTLARYLARPLQLMRDASYRLAAGDLQARAGATVGVRRDEIGDLVRDFDAMAARLEALVHSQTRMLSDISHELRSPLARLHVALALARRKAGADADVDLDRIEVEAERMNDLIGRLLALARAESSTGRDAMGPVDVGDVVTRVADDARYEAQQQRKDVRLEATEPVVVAGDAQVLASAVDNVVRNAVRHTAADSSVEITVERRGDDAVVRVRDHGPGVPPAELERIFSPFHRVEPGRQRGSGGVGLGLAIARRAVAVHGGSIQADNAPDGGLVVTLRLPADATRVSHLPDSSLPNIASS